MIARSNQGASTPSQAASSQENERLALRRRILVATHEAIIAHGYGVSTKEIAARAHISKRDLYACFANKQDIIAACIVDRAVGRPSEPLPRARSAAMLRAVLCDFGARFLHDLSDPAVTALTRLAVAEAGQHPEIAQALQEHGKLPVIRRIGRLFSEAREDGVLSGDPVAMTAQFFSLLIGDLQISLLLGLAEPPHVSQCARRAEAAVDALLGLHGSAPQRP